MIAVALLAALSGLAALGWSGVFPSGGDVAVLAATGAVAAAGTGLLARARLGVAARAGALVAGFAVVAAATAERRPPTPDALADVAVGLRDGWAQILDTRLPVDARGAPLTTALAVMWASGCLATTLHLAGRRCLRLVPPLVALAVGLLFGAPASPPPQIGAALVVAVAAGLFAARSGTGPRRRPRAAAMAAAVVVVVAVLGNGWPGASARAPFDPRDLRDQPVAVTPTDNPLAGLGGALLGPDEELFEATVPAEAVHEPWRLLALDRFDGAHWTASSPFRRLGAELSPGTDAPTTVVDETIRLGDAFTGPFLPVAGSPVRVDAGGDPDFVTDDQGAVRLASGGQPPRRYQVQAAIAAPGAARLAQAAPVTVRPLTPPAELAATLGSIVTATRQDAGSDASAAGYLNVLRDWFLDEIRLVAVDDEHGPPPTGHGYPAIARLLHDRQGTSEQFASAFAVVAELQGYDARVVVGYRPDGAPADGDPAGGEVVITSHDMYAWPEVHFEGVGWLAYHPTPSEVVTGDPASAPPPEPAARSATDSLPSSPPAGADRGEARSTDDGGGSAGSDDDGSSWLGLTLLATAGMVTVAATTMAALVVGKATRRRRQQRGTPAERVAGAWSAAVDRLAESGVDLPHHLTATEVAAAPGVPADAHAPLSELAALANACRFSIAPATEADATVAWTASTRIATAVRAEGRPLRLALSPAPLLRR
jgi:transglutaminase-like putative cysteine protease